MRRNSAALAPRKNSAIGGNRERKNSAMGLPSPRSVRQGSRRGSHVLKIPKEDLNSDHKREDSTMKSVTP